MEDPVSDKANEKDFEAGGGLERKVRAFSESEKRTPV